MENVTITMAYKQALSAHCAVARNLNTVSECRKWLADRDPENRNLAYIDQEIEALEAACKAILEAM